MARVETELYKMENFEMEAARSSWGGQKLAHRVPTEQQGINMTIGKPFKKGQSGNPGGRPKVIAEVKELAQSYRRSNSNARVHYDQSKSCTRGESVCG